VTGAVIGGYQTAEGGAHALLLGHRGSPGVKLRDRTTGGDVRPRPCRHAPRAAFHALGDTPWCCDRKPSPVGGVS
jgi:hypothetical protein